MLNKISKPHIVDFLRLSDKQRWLSPRIRYASVRSKPELIRDLLDHFRICRLGESLLFQPRHARNLPEISYDLKNRAYLIDRVKTDIPRVSRKKPSFVISRTPVTLTF